MFKTIILIILGLIAAFLEVFSIVGLVKNGLKKSKE